MDRIRHKKPHIAVIGDLMIDHYMWGTCKRVSPEAPVQIINTSEESNLLGGAGNVVNNLLSMDATVDVYSVIGDDANANLLQTLLHEKNINHIYLQTEEKRKTTKKSRIIASNQHVIRFDDETTNNITSTSQDSLFQALKIQITNYDILLLSDYGKGLLTESLTVDIIALAHKYGKPILVDPKGNNYSKYTGATLLTPNKNEASLATKIEIVDTTTLQKAISQLQKKYDLQYSIITLSEDGIALLDKKLEVIPTVAREVYDVTGAGDTVLASLGVALASKLSIKEACEFANKAAAVVVAKVGSATATLNEIEEYEHSLNKGQAESKIKNFQQIERIVKRVRAQGRKIIFTNGCFDILHRGHATYLQQAKEMGDLLIVGLNSDESITRLKGTARPVNNLEDRAFLLAALESVDYVIPFSEDTPHTLIRHIVPDVLVKGADYTDKEIVGSDIAKEVRLIQFVEGKSTSALIDKISKEFT